MNAIVSRRLGFKVHILERREPDALESEAAGIRAGPEVHQFLERYVQDYDYNYAITADSVEIMDANGNIVERLPPTAPLRLTTWKTLYDLLKREALKDDGITASVTYKTYHLVLDVDYSDDKPLITVQDLITNTIKTMEADLVVAADGAHSIIRKKLSTDRPPAYAGYVSWRGRVPEANLSLATREALQNRCVILRVDGGYQIS
jgi:2-polyprenyl-6-methoxyphenol hydroxylase-like FAD-dependent oxidoreductase